MRAVGHFVTAGAHQLDALVARLVHERRLNHDVIEVEACHFVTQVRAFVRACMAAHVGKARKALGDGSQLLQVKLLARASSAHLEFDVAVAMARGFWVFFFLQCQILDVRAPPTT